MANDLLSTDKALEDLLAELETLKSVSHQLDNAGQAMTGVTQSTQNIVRLSRVVAENSRKQTDAITDLMTDTEQRLTRSIELQQFFIDEMLKFMKTDLQPQLIQMQKSLSINRWLLVVVLLLIFSDLAFGIWRFLAQ